MYTRKEKDGGNTLAVYNLLPRQRRFRLENRRTIIIARAFVSSQVLAKKNRRSGGENNSTLLDSRILRKYTQIRINRAVTAWRGAIEGSADQLRKKLSVPDNKPEIYSGLDF